MIQYSGGTNINATLTQVAGTRAELVDWIITELTAAGWTVAVAGTHDSKMNSAVTPQSLQMRARIYDPGAGNCARIKISNISEGKIQVGDFFLLPAVSKVWRIIANKYQAFILTAGAPLGRDFCAFGTPYVPTLSTPITEALWGHGNARTDTDVSNDPTFRTRLAADLIATGNNTQCYQLCNNSAVESNNLNTNTSANPGRQRLISTVAALDGQVFLTGFTWNDGAQFVLDPLIAWGNTAFSDAATVKGQLWDAILLSDAWTDLAAITYDTHNWLGITNNNGGVSGQYTKGTLFHVVP